MNLRTIFVACIRWFAEKLLAPIILIGLAFAFGNFFLSFTIHRNHEETQSLVVVDRFYETSLTNLVAMTAEYDVIAGNEEGDPLPDPILAAQQARFRSLQVDSTLLEDAGLFPVGAYPQQKTRNPASRIVEMFRTFDPLAQGSDPRIPRFADLIETPSQPKTSRLRGDLPELIEIRIRPCHRVMRTMIFARNVGPTRLHRWVAQATANARLRRPTKNEEICYADA